MKLVLRPGKADDAEAGGAICYAAFKAIAGVGPITVNPTVQNLALGKRLLENVLQRAHARHFAGVRLVQAAYHNRSLSLYTKLGFDAREPLSTLQGPALGLAIPGRLVRAASERDLAACNQLSFKLHGHERGPELLDAIKAGTSAGQTHNHYRSMKRGQNEKQCN